MSAKIILAMLAFIGIGATSVQVASAPQFSAEPAVITSLAPTTMPAPSTTTTTVAPTTTAHTVPTSTTMVEAPPVSRTEAPPTGHVFVVGDSLTAGMENVGYNAGGNKITAWPGMTTPTGISVVQSQNLNGIDTVLIALGTNDYLASASAYGAEIDTMMQAVGNRHVYWVNVDAGRTVLAPAASGVNAALVSATARYSNLTVLDWNGYFNSIPNHSQYYGDAIHYNVAGYRIRSDFYRSNVA